MRDLYVIVKEAGVRMFVKKSPVNSKMWRDATAVLQEIERIRKEESYLRIKGFSSQLHPKMPPPSQDLSVRVVGALRDVACAIQLYNLRLAGYSASFYEPGCLDFEMKSIQPGMLPRFRELVPEYYLH